MVLSTVSTKDVKSKDSVKKTRKPNVGKQAESSSTTADDRVLSIAVNAYYKAESRGFEPEYEIQDWLEAEAEVMQ